MVGRLFTLASALSLLMCAATVVLWVRSHWHQDVVERIESFHPPWFQEPGNEKDLTLDATSIDGVLLIEWLRFSPTDLRTQQNVSYKWICYSAPMDGPFLPRGILRAKGMPHCISAGPYGVTYGDWLYGWRFSLLIPHWLLASVLLLAPAGLFWTRFLKRVRPRTGCCLRCDYDLRATPSRCPECGTPVPTKQEASG